MNEQRKPVYTISRFCADHSISRTFLHQLKAQGKAPRMMAVGRRVLITDEAARDWRGLMEREAAADIATPQSLPSAPIARKQAA